MSNGNPYSPPQTEVADPINDIPGNLRDAPRSNGIGRGWGWLAEGFGLFKAAPGIWILNIILFFVLLFLLMLIPLLGSLGQALLSPIFTGGLMKGCHDLDRGEDLTVAHLFSGFQERAGALMGVGAISMVGTVIIVIAAVGISGVGMGTFMALESGGEMSPEQLQQMLPAILLMSAVMMGLMVPLMMAVWFAPALLMLHKEVGVLQALKLSFVGCIKNILPFLLYGIIGMLLAIVATIPVGLGWLVLAPMMFASIYAAYKGIFVE